MNAIVAGTLLAVASAVAFGLTTPFIQRLGVGVGPFTTAALLYVGASLGAVAWKRSAREVGVRAEHLPRLAVVALFGAALAPSLFAWGLQRVPATYGSLLLHAEAVFTVALAALFFKEHIGTRVWLAAALMFLGGVVTVVGAASGGAFQSLLGALAVVVAVFSWALDNVLTRPFSNLDPSAVVRVKALFGVALTSVLALARAEVTPGWQSAVGLLLCGATGYGLSLRLYLLAQRRIGAARTGSVFSIAPFVGAVVSLALGDRPAGFTALLAAALFIAGLVLHLTERHGHQHRHAPLRHEHAHRHDDDHHDHHDDAPVGMHTHWHTHDARTHAHAHGPDAHHDHEH